MSGTHGETQTPRRTDCDELRDLLPAYMIGATTLEESARVRTLLPQCPEVAAEAAEYAALSRALSETVEPVPPPARVKSALMARLAEREANREGSTPTGTAASQPRLVAAPTASPPASPTVMPVDAVKPVSRRSPVAWGLAAAAAILLIATNVYWLTQNGARQAELDAVRGELARTDTLRETAFALMSNLDTQRVALESTGDQTTSLATLYWNTLTNQGAIVTNNLPRLAADQTYQLWLIAAGTPLSAGTFNLDESGWGWLSFQATGTLKDYQAFGISVEPAGGSEQPTTTPIAVGQIST